MPGSQDFAVDPRNTDLKIYLNGALLPRAEAKVSVFDAGFVLGDGVWEGLRLHKGALLFLEAHLERLYAGLAKIELDLGIDRVALTAEIRRTLAANGMEDGAHLRLMVTRGEKAAVNQDPRNWLGRPTLVITALLDAIHAGADEAVMLDPHGHVSSCNATNLFWVRDGRVATSTGDYCFNGVTRANVIALCRDNDIPITLGDFELSDLHAADEAFVTGTFGGLTPVREIDGIALPAALPGPITTRLKALYEALKDAEAA